MQYRRLRSAANLGGDVVELTLMSTACKWFVCLYRTRGWPCLAPAQQRRPHSAAEAGNGRWKWTRWRGGPSLPQRLAVCKVSQMFLSRFPLPSLPPFGLNCCLACFCLPRCWMCVSLAVFLSCWQVRWYLGQSVRKLAIKDDYRRSSPTERTCTAASGPLQSGRLHTFP